MLEGNIKSDVDLSIWGSYYTDTSYKLEKTHEEILDDIPIQIIEKYLRRKKLKKIKDGTKK